jgi:hypothetical protein
MWLTLPRGSLCPSRPYIYYMAIYRLKPVYSTERIQQLVLEISEYELPRALIIIAASYFMFTCVLYLIVMICRLQCLPQCHTLLSF